MYLRTLLLPCYLQLLGVDVGVRDVAADAAVAMLFAAVGGRCWGARCLGEINLRLILYICALNSIEVHF